MSLVSYWDMNEDSGNALDSHGSNELTDNNTVGTEPGPGSRGETTDAQMARH